MRPAEGNAGKGKRERLLAPTAKRHIVGRERRRGRARLEG